MLKSKKSLGKYITVVSHPYTYEVDGFRFDTIEQARRFASFNPDRAVIDPVMSRQNQYWAACAYEDKSARYKAFQHAENCRSDLEELGYEL